MRMSSKQNRKDWLIRPQDVGWVKQADILAGLRLLQVVLSSYRVWNNG